MQARPGNQASELSPGQPETAGRPARPRGRVLAAFPGERKVWIAAAAVGLPLALLALLYCVQPRSYNLGTDSVEAHSYLARVRPGRRLCVPGLLIPGGTGAVRFNVISMADQRPPLRLSLAVDGHTISSRVGTAHHVAPGQPSAAVFQIPPLSGAIAAHPAIACLTASGAVALGGTPLPSPPSFAPTLAGRPLSGRIAVWYLPPRSQAQRSYLDRAGAILARASLFRPGWVGPWLYVVMFLLLLPALAYSGVRCLALAAAGRAPRRVALWLFAIAAVNFACWAVITPPFQNPDELDHFAYVQSLVERGHAPSQDRASPLRRWSSAETLALEAAGFFTDHLSADSRPPWLARQDREYARRASTLRPASDNGGGYETAAAHGPIYYAALAPAYVLAADSPFSQLTLMRLLSALIGALTVVFTFLLARELAPGRLWLAIVAALLVAYEPMFGSIAGAVNNDVGVNAGAAALEWLLIRMLRRGVTVRSGAATGLLLAALPEVKGTALSLYPVAALVLLVALWRRHDRSDARGWLALAGTALAMALVSALLLGGAHASGPAPGSSLAAASGTSAVGGALGNIPDFASYLWQVFLPRLPFMTEHFNSAVYPAWSIFVIRGWAAFGSYAVAFPDWVSGTLAGAMIVTLLLCPFAARREWAWVRSHGVELVVLLAMPASVIVGFEAAYYTAGVRPVIAEVGRYAFPAIGPLAVLVVGALHAFGRERMLWVASGLLAAMIALSFASQLLTLTSFYA